MPHSWCDYSQVELSSNSSEWHSDARCHISGVTTVKQSWVGSPLSDTDSDARCHIPSVTMDKLNWEEY